MGDISQAESAVVIDLFLSYRAVKGWSDMVELAGKMSKPLSSTVLVQEQLALALNRMRQGERAEKILLDLIQQRGPSSETYGILGRVYKDRWTEAVKSGQPMLARGMLEKAIGAYGRCEVSLLTAQDFWLFGYNSDHVMDKLWTAPSIPSSLLSVT